MELHKLGTYVLSRPDGQINRQGKARGDCMHLDVKDDGGSEFGAQGYVLLPHLGEMMHTFNCFGFIGSDVTHNKSPLALGYISFTNFQW